MQQFSVLQLTPCFAVSQMTDNNRVNGTIPKELGQLSGITFLHLGAIENVYYCCIVL
jgi:hypothetical protein